MALPPLINRQLPPKAAPQYKDGKKQAEADFKAINDHISRQKQEEMIKSSASHSHRKMDMGSIRGEGEEQKIEPVSESSQP